MTNRNFARAAAPPTPANPLYTGDVNGLASLYRRWQDDCPDIEKTVAQVIKHYPFDRAAKKLIMAAARLAAEPAAHAFHNNRHFLEVFAASFLLGHKAVQSGRLPINDFKNLLVAALVHDYGHDGGVNGTTQFRLEQMAFDNTKAALATAGATPDDLLDIEAYVLATDVTKNFSRLDAVSPAESIMAYATTRNPDDLHPRLRRLHERGISDVALMIHDADLARGMIAHDLSVQGGRYLAEERRTEYVESGQIWFLHHICHRRAASQSGKKLFQPFLDAVLHAFGQPPAPGRKNG